MKHSTFDKITKLSFNSCYRYKELKIIFIEEYSADFYYFTES